MTYRKQSIYCAVLAVALGVAAPAGAQLVISGGGVSGSGANSGNVIVDRDVLDRLGQPRTLPSLLNPEPPAPTAPVTLRPPQAEKLEVKPAKPPKKQALAKPEAPSRAKVAAKAKSARVAAPTPAKPIPEAPKPAITEAPKRVVAEAPKPVVAEIPKPAVVEAPKPVAPETPKPVVAEAPKPVVAETPTPVVAEAPKPVAPKPVVPEPPKPVKADAPKPFVDPPKPTRPDPKPAMTAPSPVTPAPQPEVTKLPAPPPPPPAPPVEARGLVPPPPVPEVAVVQPPPEAPKPIEPPKPQPTKPAVVPASVGAAPKAGYVERAGKATIHFAADQAELPEDARSPLEELARRMEKDPALFLQLLAYADGSESEASKARRLSLSRALAVRSYLMNYGLRSTRIDVRALGNRVPEGPADRVDLVVEKR